MIATKTGVFFYYIEKDSDKLISIDGYTIIDTFMHPSWIIIKDEHYVYSL